MQKIDYKQMGVRIDQTKYRRLKSTAALMGVPMRVVVEAAIEGFLAKPHPKGREHAELDLVS